MGEGALGLRAQSSEANVQGVRFKDTRQCAQAPGQCSDLQRIGRVLNLMP